jgi:hypothetical protein
MLEVVTSIPGAMLAAGKITEKRPIPPPSGPRWHIPRALLAMGRTATWKPVKKPDKLRRVLELVYGVEGVVGARVWDLDGTIAVGIRPAPHAGPQQLLQRVERALKPLREPGEAWELGLLGEDEA